MRVAHAQCVHVRERALQVVDVRSPAATTLRDEPGGVLDIEVARELVMRLVGHERERAHDASAAEAHRDQPRQVHVIAHLAPPQRGEDVALAAVCQAVGHPPARSATAQTHDQAGPFAGATVAVGKNAQRAVIAVDEAALFLAVGKSGRPHERCVAEHPQCTGRQQRKELLELQRGVGGARCTPVEATGAIVGVAFLFMIGSERL
jgi:hypothetical protein